MVEHLQHYVLLCCVVFAGCRGEPGSRTSSASTLPNGLNPDKVAELTERIESENFVFHYRPGDTIRVDRQEALHRWAVDYLDIVLPKKIDYYKFEFADMEEAVGMYVSGSGYPQDYAFASIYPWHAHESMHIYTYGLCNHATIRLFDEGMSVAHDFDPLNEDWVAKWRRWPGRGSYVYADRVRAHRAARRLHPIAEIVESRSFEAARARERGTVNNRVLYDQAGMFVSYLIDTFGIDKMKRAICSVGRNDPRDTILVAFKEVFGLSVLQVEEAWLAHIDASALR